ncbi:unnamed protein product [Sphagnum compactum]
MNKADDYSRSVSAELNDGGEKLGKSIRLTPKSTTGPQTSAPSSERQFITASPALSSARRSFGIPAHSLVKPLSPPSASASLAPAFHPFVAPSPTPAKEEQPRGGLRDVVGAPPKAFSPRGRRVMVLPPRYSSCADASKTGIHQIYNVSGQVSEATLTCFSLSSRMWFAVTAETLLLRSDNGLGEV